MPFYEEIAEKYADRDVVVMNVYVREPHAGERGFPEIQNHESYEHKLGYAKDLFKIKNMKKTILLVDEMEQKIHGMLGELPNFVYLIDRDGRVKYKATWSDAEHVDEYLAEMVNNDPAFADKPKLEHTIFTQTASTQI